MKKFNSQNTELRRIVDASDARITGDVYFERLDGVKCEVDDRLLTLDGEDSDCCECNTRYWRDAHNDLKGVLSLTGAKIVAISGDLNVLLRGGTGWENLPHKTDEND